MEKPLLVSGPLIKPILQQWKTETRRTAGLGNINQEPDRYTFVEMEYLDRSGIFRAVFWDSQFKVRVLINCPYGGRGTTLWVRENWFTGQGYELTKPRDLPKPTQSRILHGFTADGEKPQWAGKTRPAIHMPRWMSRILLTNQDTYPQRLHAITEKDAKREGVDRGLLRDGPNTMTGEFQLELTCKGSPIGTFLDGFKFTWMNLNGRDSWDPNPWVWVIKFNLKTDDNAKSTTDAPGN